MNTKMFVIVVLQVIATCVFAFLFGWTSKARQDEGDLKLKFKVGQKIAIKYLEEFVDDGKDTAENVWYRNEKKYLSYGQAIIVGIEWWPTKGKGMSYWIGSMNPGYKSFVSVPESELRKISD